MAAYNKAKIAQTCYITAYHKIRLRASQYDEKRAVECMQVMLRFLMHYSLDEFKENDLAEQTACWPPSTASPAMRQPA